MVNCPLPADITTLDVTGLHCIYNNAITGLDTCTPVGPTDCCREGNAGNGEGCLWATGTLPVNCPLPAAITTVDTDGTHCTYTNVVNGIDTCTPVGTNDCCREDIIGNGEGCLWATGTGTL